MQNQNEMSREEVREALGLPPPGETPSGRSWATDEDGITYMIPPTWTMSKSALTRADERCLTCGRIGDCICSPNGGPCEWCEGGRKKRSV